MSNQATNTAAAAAPAKAKKPSIVDTFLKGCAKGFKVGIENITPAMILGYVLVYILKETGLMDILGTVMSPVMGLFGLPGEAFAVLISAFFAKASGCATAASMYEAGALTLGQASMMLPACILMGTLIGHYARIVLVTDTNKKWHPLLIAVCLLDAAISLVIMRIILAAMGVQEKEAEHMLSKLSRRRGLQLEALGSVLICTVMLADRFLFTLQDGFVLTTAIISAVLLTIGIRVVKRHDEENQN